MTGSKEPARYYGHLLDQECEHLFNTQSSEASDEYSRHRTRFEPSAPNILPRCGEVHLNVPLDVCPHRDPINDHAACGSHETFVERF
jgi:hypothetical protein